MKKLMLVLMLCTMLSFVSADFQPQKQLTDFNLVISSNNATTCNWSYIQYPDGSQTIYNLAMSKNAQTFNYTVNYNNFSQIGQTCMGVSCTDGTTIQTGSVCRQVNVVGQDLSGSKASTYIVIVIISLIIFTGLLVVGIFLPSKNRSDEMTGYIIAVENLKYVKYLALGLAYLVATFISYFMWMLCFAYLDMPFLTVLFQFLFYAEAIAIIPLFIVMIYIVIANKIRDDKIADFLMRGLHVKNGN